MNTTDLSIATTDNAWTPLRAALMLIILCGGIYPVVTTLVAGALFPHQATGSIIEVDGKTVGSELVGQPFASERYFYGRPSAAGFDPFSLAGSNWAPSNPDLRKRVRAQARQIVVLEGVPVEEIPVDLLAASGSGIDPHISPEAANIQVARIVNARGVSDAQVLHLVNEYTEPPTLSIFGQPRVHVLRLNLALDRLADGAREDVNPER